MIKGLISKLFLFLRKVAYSSFSNNKNISGFFKSYQPVVIRGKGAVVFGDNVTFGVINSPRFYNTYAYIEARTNNSNIIIGNNVHINNSFSMTSENSITIKNDVLIGCNCQISDSNFHNLDSDKRDETDPNPLKIVIGNNVFIGNNVTILKGVIIGENSVISAGAIVTKSFPGNVVIGGCPAKIIRELN